MSSIMADERGITSKSYTEDGDSGTSKPLEKQRLGEDEVSYLLLLGHYFMVHVLRA